MISETVELELLILSEQLHRLAEDRKTPAKIDEMRHLVSRMSEVLSDQPALQPALQMVG